MWIVVAVLALILGYVWARLVRAPRWPRRATWIATLAYLVFVAASLGALSFGDEGPATEPGPIRLVGLMGAGVLFYALVYFLGAGLTLRLSRLARRWRARRDPRPALPTPPPTSSGAIDRRTFVARVTAAGVSVAATTTAAVGFRNAWDLDLPEVVVSLPKLPRALDGFRIVQMSDVHVGRVLTDRFLEHVVEQTLRLRPDAVVITGDLIEGRAARLAPELAPLGRLAERCGVYYVTGNHEYYAGDAVDWVERLRALGVRVLVNERAALGDRDPRGAQFDLAGIPDQDAARFVASHAPDLGQALAGRDAERALVVLAHRPAQIEQATRHHADLQISGHTHGGQAFPFSLLVHLAEPYVAGLHRHGDETQIYVSRGTGFFGPPLRVLAPAELTSIMLTS